MQWCNRHNQNLFSCSGCWKELSTERDQLRQTLKRVRTYLEEIKDSQEPWEPQRLMAITAIDLIKNDLEE